nr:DUF1049 domain-containing protein [uncultured Gellertiella sp.]
MFRKAINIVILLPLAIVLILLSVANRQGVTLALNPFRPDDSVLSLSAPFFVFLFVALIIGILAGSAVTWLAQGKYRRRARMLRDENLKWQKTGSDTAAPPRNRQIEA